jgi:hypothetical protein
MGNQHINIVIFQHEKVLPHNSLEIPSSPNRTFQDKWCGHGATTVWLPSSPNIKLSGNFEISALLRNNTHLSLSCLHFLSSAPSSDTVKLCEISFPPFPRVAMLCGDFANNQEKERQFKYRGSVAPMSSVKVSQLLNIFHSEQSAVMQDSEFSASQSDVK